MKKTLFSLIIIYLTSSFSQENVQPVIFSDSVDVVYFWEIERYTLTNNNKNSALNSVVDFYLSKMFKCADSCNQIRKLILFTKYSDAAAEALVDNWVNLINTKQKLFESCIRDVEKPLLEFFIDYLTVFSYEDSARIKGIIERVKKQK